MPPPDKYPPGSWEWNETGAEIVLKNKDIPEVKIARLYEFFKKDKINAKGWGEKTVARLYNAGFDTLKKLTKLGLWLYRNSVILNISVITN